MPEIKPSRKSILELSKKYLEKVNPYDEPAAKLKREIKELKESVDPELEKKIQKLIEYFGSHGIDYDKIVSKKKAYPNFDQYMYIPGRHDMKKWMLALKDVHYKQKGGLAYKDSIRQATSGWPKMEVYDFLNWLRFYEEGAHMKYKFAQVWYENGQPGYFLHIKPDPAPAPEPIVDANAVNDARQEAEKKEERKQTIEKQRQKIIGRLDSAEKLLRSPEGQMFAGDELENLMEAIYSLKKKVQLVNKISVSTRLYEDMIVREANVLKRNGFVKAAEMLYSVAQTPGASAEGAKGEGSGADLSPSPPADPSGAGQSGTMSGLPSTAPGTPSVQTPVDGDQNTDTPPIDKLKPPAGPGGETTISSPAIMPQEKPQPKGIKEFIENMNQGNKTEEDDLEVVDELEVVDPEMVVEAQAAPAVPPGVPPAALEDVPMTDEPAPERRPPAFIPTVVPTPEKPADEKPLEVTEEDIPAPITEPTTPSNGFSAKINDTFADVTLQDIVAELEDISKSYKTREQPRRLGWVDMALDSKGLASFFPSLSEAQNKALEANNYISTRIDDILAKLRGAIASQETGPAAPVPESPELAGVKGKLQSEQEKEKQRKQMRKEQEAAALEGTKKETPEVELGELGAPAAPAPAPAPAAPPAPRPLG